ncbi:MAG: hypothetical protein IBX50_07970 [Marinospirillum sp.]|uniref:hypothetical protein n=1 Tax=Marinospirillum sp. TaxID=2183934 RepID=UPI0019DF1C67|nr:hypothetical protein [Marinospirillum sp.]MBE0506642.1 hypothetical protein [Marinospirillum sp.]
MVYSRARFIGSLLSIVAAMSLIGCDAQNDVSTPDNASKPANVAENKSASHPPEGYSVSVSGRSLNDSQVHLVLTTSIPGTIELMASISLADQAPDDTWIGKNERVRLVNGIGQATFDVSDLPTGQYEVAANFYPRWGFQDEESRSSGVSESLEHSHPISLKGSGESSELVAQRNEDQQWVIENVIMGSEWDPSFWRDRFGEWEEFPVTTRNPDIISNYYFESLEMTLIVNTLKDEVVVWRMGRDGL